MEKYLIDIHLPEWVHTESVICEVIPVILSVLFSRNSLNRDLCILFP